MQSFMLSSKCAQFFCLEPLLLATIANYQIVCCEAVRSAILATSLVSCFTCL